MQPLPFGENGREDQKMAPSEYFKRRCAVSVEPDEATFKQVIEFIGGRSIVFPPTIRTATPSTRKPSTTF
jgi:hypothetical protein